MVDWTAALLLLALQQLYKNVKFSPKFPWLSSHFCIFPDFLWPLKFPDLFQFSLTCRNPVRSRLGRLGSAPSRRHPFPTQPSYLLDAPVSSCPFSEPRMPSDRTLIYERYLNEMHSVTHVSTGIRFRPGLRQGPSWVSSPRSRRLRTTVLVGWGGETPIPHPLTLSASICDRTERTSNVT